MDDGVEHAWSFVDMLEFLVETCIALMVEDAWFGMGFVLPSCKAISADLVAA